MHNWTASKSPPVNGIIDNTVVSRLYLNKGKRPVHQLMIVLEHEVLWTHLQGGHIGVLGKGTRWRMKQSGRREGKREGGEVWERGRIEQAQTVELLRDSPVAVPGMQMLIPRGGALRNNHKIIA